MNQVAIQRRKRFYQGLLEQGVRSGTKVVQQQSPGMTYNSASVTAHRMLRDIKTRPEFMEERAKIAELEELDQIATSFVRDDKKPDQTRLKAMELSYRRKGALIDKNINENTDKTAQEDLIRDRAAKMALEYLQNSSKSLTDAQGLTNSGEDVVRDLQPKETEG